QRRRTMSVTTEQPAGPTAIRPFRVDIPDEELAELRRRIAATRWPSKELVTDLSQGVQLATLQELARYWGTDYDWRRCEAKLNALPHFMTVPSRDFLAAGLRVLRQADYHRLGSRPDRTCLGSPDEAAWIQPVRGAGRRLGCGRHS